MKTLDAPSRAAAPRRAVALQPLIAQVLTFDAASGAWSLDCAGQPRLARRAASCLVEPEPGDTVACLEGGGRAWVTAVLERAAGGPATVCASGGLRIGGPGAPLELQADTLTMRAQRLQAEAEQATVTLEQADLMARRLNIVAATVRSVGALWSSVFDRVQHFSQQYQRTTEGLDRVEAAQLQCEASQLLQLHGEHTLINGEKLVKARGAQIHFG